MKKSFLYLSLALFATSLFGQSNSITKIDQYLKEYHAKIPIPGFSVVIVEENKITFSKAYGVEIKGQKKPMTTKSPVGIGSLGQGFTALAILQLVDKGLVDLDEPIVNYLPWFKTANKEFSDLITLRMCLSNATGIPSQFESIPDLDPTKSLEQFVRSLSAYYVTKKPGTSHEFSNEGFSIAGLVISELSGMSYPEYIEKNILVPLGMKNTTTDPNKLESLNVLHGHEMALTECIPAKKGTINGNYLPAGSIMRSSADDLGNYMITLLNEGIFKNKKIVSPNSLQELFTPNVSFQGLGTMLGGNGIDIQNCLGWLEMEIEGRTIDISTGNNGNMAAILGLNRSKKQGIALLFNGDVNSLNRYVYPNLENTANNVIHILNNEETTDFAIVRFDDPWEDEDYVLPKNKWDKYLGEYLSYGKESPFFKDMAIEIFIGDSGAMELKSHKEKALKGHYTLQFTNESRAVLRNISQPRTIQFKLYPNGFIGGLFMFGSQFKKKDAVMEARFVNEVDAANSLSFLFPKTAIKKWTNNAFEATFPSHPDAKLSFAIKALASQNFDNFIEQTIGNQPIINKGILQKENVKDGIWTEQSLFVKKNGQTKQYLFVFFQDPVSNKQIQLVLTNPWGSFSSELQEMMMYFQKTVSF